ncbi:hypothetical protein A2572_04205 [Candidatus Collierbacteria bacterium RIFOXYD1_FULL_40_9]|uniref:Radical SAM core domain-containing protein n=1 Tax=Candidatus Collierbacteria bacterium RIFOXYD1_FULL_40_9 TaxID=1817731 RepID=A0A1F5FPL3_9BACT|nr:MAG: hypothetical protein A2572_04205 [Candidatus Collierbacteria bacterium RIFOXYD1_FULL_40_9]
MIVIKSKNALLEITNRCYTGCYAEYCYKKLTISSKGNHIDLDVIKRRVDWVAQFTDCESITLLGGEPLLHPKLKEICEYILAKGLKLDFITSGKISKIPYEISNLEYVLDLYERAETDFQLSYHFGRNQKEYVSTHNQLIKRYLKRREKLKKKKRYVLEHYDFFSTTVITGGMKRNEFEEFVLQVLSDNGWSGTDQKYLNEMWDGYVNHSYRAVSNFSYTISSTDDWMQFRQSVRFIGVKDIFDVKGSFYVSLPEGGVCYGANATINGNQIQLGALHIRADGGVTFPNPQCIDMPNPMANVDLHLSKKDIYEALKGSLAQVQKHVYYFNRLKAKDNCGPDGKELACTACPFDKMCTPCWHTKRPWQK